MGQGDLDSGLKIYVSRILAFGVHCIRHKISALALITTDKVPRTTSLAYLSVLNNTRLFITYQVQGQKNVQRTLSVDSSTDGLCEAKKMNQKFGKWGLFEKFHIQSNTYRSVLIVLFDRPMAEQSLA